MEIVVYPRSFGIQPGKATTPQGDVDVVRVNVQDAGPAIMTPAGPVQIPGPVVTVVQDLESWQLFKDAIADPEGAQAKQQARSKIVVVNGQAPSLKKLL